MSVDWWSAVVGCQASVCVCVCVSVYIVGSGFSSNPLSCGLESPGRNWRVVLRRQRRPSRTEASSGVLPFAVVSTVMTLCYYI